ncbi:PREDICTED: uncharacterized protein C18orf8 [Tarenaya hassleriana]|uniref:uncharacterized protein C18orf8 n=1 Tax=Tarenaya hassleriana TaxID=28532 RepID=UPI00053C2341|nr:PREDICTED: uncharacterized protein C18orf8 [Tarenaya hassleriana]XP_010520012.1 PREDICTED: uncharacterized protein C18orf8 [Tarenaya hassleriana]XP_010520013.1 PREDICTED: uncharacterized protein C18orf8 [Tarenaya hassleriana]
MANNPSSSQAGVCSGGSGTLSHVYIQHPPLCGNIPGSRGWFYDDANRLLISTTPSQVFSWKTAPFDPNVVPSEDSISEGPILSIRFSLDLKLIAVQRSDSEIQFFNRETKQIYSHKCKVGSESILGFLWSDCPLCDIAIVKTSGLDLFVCDSTSMTLRLVETKKQNVSWFIYTHETRLVLLASGVQCKTFTGFQLSSAGIVRLPRFEMAMAKSEANSKPVLSSKDVHLVTVYGRIYCLQVDRAAMLLHLYRFYRDAVIQQGSLPIYSSKLAVSMVDNVLLVHQIEAKVVIIYDLFVDSRAPVSAPLPLLLRGSPRSGIMSQAADEENEGSETTTSAEDIVMYEDGWTFLVPDLILDRTNSVLWKIHLDVEAISASTSEVASLLEFLQRRKLEANKAKQLCFGIARTIILERRPVTLVSRAIEVLVTSYSNAVRTGTYKNEKTTMSSTPNTVAPQSRADASSDNERHTSSGSNIDEAEMNLSSGSKDNMFCANISEQQESQLTSPAISPDELYKFVFASLDEVMAEESDYLVAIITEFLRSAGSEKLKVPPDVYVMTIKLLAHSKRHTELAIFITNKIIEPSKEVAFQLLESGCQNSQIRKLGLDMLRQLSLQQDYILCLVQDGYYLEALRYAQKHKVRTVPPLLFLEAAYAANDMQHLASILRVLSELVPGFQGTSEYYTYSSLLGEMSSSVAV